MTQEVLQLFSGSSRFVREFRRCMELVFKAARAYQRRQGGFLDISSTRQNINEPTSQQGKPVSSGAYRKAGQGVWAVERRVNVITVDTGV